MANVNAVCEPMPHWGGAWTNEKLDIFEKYVKAYLTIMAKYAVKHGWETIYVDAFAGSGTRGEAKPSPSLSCEPTLFDELEIINDEIDVYKGAAERVLSIEDYNFDHFIFIDKDKESLEMSRKHLSECHPSKKNKLSFRENDANAEVKNIANGIRKYNYKYAALFLLDPFGMQVDWETIESFKGLKHIDLWILVPTGVIINRLLKRDGTLLHPQKLVEHLGIPKEEIHNTFYEIKTEETLFGEITIKEKIDSSISIIDELYRKKLNTIFTYVSDMPLVLYNSNKCPIYHFVFASNNATAKNIAQEIVKAIK